MNFLIFKEDAKRMPSTLPTSFFEPEAKEDKKATKPAKTAKKPVEESPGIDSLIESNPSKKQVIEYFKSRIEELTA